LLIEEFSDPHFDIRDYFLVTLFGGKKVSQARQVIIEAFVRIVVDVKNTAAYIY
jgi:hypothetical protein